MKQKSNSRFIYLPVLYLDTTDATEVVNVICHHHHLMMQSDGADGHIKVLYFATDGGEKCLLTTKCVK